MKLLLAVIATIAATQVDWVEGQGTNVTTMSGPVFPIGCTCDQIVIRENGDEPGTFTGVWDRLRDPVNGGPAYKMQNNFEEIILKWDNFAAMWIAVSNMSAVFHQIPVCPEDLSSVWLYQDLSVIPLTTESMPNMTARCLNCTKNPEDCPKDYDGSMRLRVSDFPSIAGFSITPAEADGFYDRVIGEMRDDRFVYINPQSRIWFYSYSFRWIFSPSFGEDLYEAIYGDDDVTYDYIMNVTEIRPSDCSDSSMIQDECDPDCEPCKEVLEGPMRGDYNLAAQSDPRCVDGCVYTRYGKNYCFVPGGPLVKQGCS